MHRDSPPPSSNPPLLLHSPPQTNPAPPPLPPLDVVAGVFITGSTSDAIINAFRDNARRFNADPATKAANQRVRLRFFVGAGGHPLQRAEGYPGDIVSCACAENMNAGKTYEWWSHAAASFNGSNYVLKVDTDSAMNWPNMLSLLARRPAATFLGHLNDNKACGGFSHCPPKGCEGMDGDCWVYMSGGMYGMSLDLAAAVAACPWAKANAAGYEDMVSGRMVKHCAAGPVNVTHIRNGYGWCHGKRNTPDHLRNGTFPKGCGE